jgi:hypothetical protein
VNLRHDARHAYQRIHASKAHADAPYTRCTDDVLAEGLVTRGETEHGSRSVGYSLVDGTVGVMLEPRVVHLKPELMKHSGDLERVRLLTLHADRESFAPAEKKEGVERTQTVPDGVNHKRHFLDF